MRDWSIQQVARASGVTARALRYYDEIGLLHPARVGVNGYRYYEQEQLQRLQQLLLLRELGVDLATVGRILDDQRDELEALRTHHRLLLAERRRLDSLAETVADTIAHLEAGDVMPGAKLFAGFRFTRDRLDEFEAAEFGGGAGGTVFAEIRVRVAGWCAGDFSRVDHAGADIEHRVLALLRAGVPVDDPAVFSVLDDDVAAQRGMWTLTAERYAGLGAAFSTVPRLRIHLDAQDPRLADYLRDAMVAYARERLAHADGQTRAGVNHRIARGGGAEPDHEGEPSGT